MVTLDAYSRRITTQHSSTRRLGFCRCWRLLSSSSDLFYLRPCLGMLELSLWPHSYHSLWTDRFVYYDDISICGAWAVMHHQALHGAFISSPYFVQPLPLLARVLPYRFASHDCTLQRSALQNVHGESLAAKGRRSLYQHHLGGVSCSCIAQTVDSSAARH